MKPSIPKGIVSRIKSAAGQRFGHEVEVAWDELEGRFIVMAFNPQSGKCDVPWIVVQTDSGAYKCPDDTTVALVQKCVHQDNTQRKEIAATYNRKRLARQRLMVLASQIKALRKVQARAYAMGELTPGLTRKIEELTDEWKTLTVNEQGGFTDYYELAKDITAVLSGKRVIAAS
jgi:hypothetical protein